MQNFSRVIIWILKKNITLSFYPVFLKRVSTRVFSLVLVKHMNMTYFGNCPFFVTRSDFKNLILGLMFGIPFAVTKRYSNTWSQASGRPAMLLCTFPTDNNSISTDFQHRYGAHENFLTVVDSHFNCTKHTPRSHQGSLRVMRSVFK